MSRGKRKAGEDAGGVRKSSASFTSDESALIRKALKLIEERTLNGGQILDTPRLVKDYLRLRLAGLEREVFGAIFLDSQNRFIGIEELFRGTVSETTVHPREVVKAALRHNASNVFFFHNHPHGAEDPSPADRRLSKTLRDTLALIDVTVLDEFIVTSKRVVSLAQRDLFKTASKVMRPR
jgi:DNA repair protein RadC